MKTSIEKVAKFIGAAAWADGVYEEAEKEAVEEIAEAFEFNTMKFSALVDQTHRELAKLEEDDYNRYLKDAGAAIQKDEAGQIFEACMQIVLADGILCTEEVTNLLTMADALGVETPHAVLMLADMVKDEPDMAIEF